MLRSDEVQTRRYSQTYMNNSSSLCRMKCLSRQPCIFTASSKHAILPSLLSVSLMLCRQKGSPWSGMDSGLGDLLPGLTA